MPTREGCSISAALSNHTHPPNQTKQLSKSGGTGGRRREEGMAFYYICIDGDIHLVTRPRLKRRIQAMGNDTDTDTDTDTDMDTNKDNDALSSMDSRLRISTTDDR